MALVVGALSACSDNGTAPPPSPTTAVIALTTPNSDDGALLIALRGPELSDVRAVAAGSVVYARYPATGEAHVVVVGDIAAGRLLTLKLGAGHPLSDYSATVEQVAMRNDSLRGAIDGYRLTLQAQP